MAKILVAGPQAGALDRAFLAKIVERLRSLGQDASLIHEADAKIVRDADAVVAWLDGARPDPVATALAAFANALGKPTLGIRSEDAGHKPLDPFLQAIFTTLHQSAEAQGLLDGLNAFTEQVRPFAGRLVRDEIPRLVKEAGHHVTFRQVPKEDRPRFLKEKVAKEAQELAKADLASEKEEVADILESLEAFIRSRDYDRDALRLVKEAKHRRRGGFERCFVVESTAEPEEATEAPVQEAPMQEPLESEVRRERPTSRFTREVEPMPEPVRETSLDQGGFDYVEKPVDGFEYDDAKTFDPTANETAPEPAKRANRDVEPTLYDL